MSENLLITKTIMVYGGHLEVFPSINSAKRNESNFFVRLRGLEEFDE